METNNSDVSQTELADSSLAYVTIKSYSWMLSTTMTAKTPASFRVFAAPAFISFYLTLIINAHRIHTDQNNSVQTNMPPCTVWTVLQYWILSLVTSCVIMIWNLLKHWVEKLSTEFQTSLPDVHKSPQCLGHVTVPVTENGMDRVTAH